ncbi:MAG: c-type cytochrome [Planctomycetes bacterium]|nr:c-type cytochrome [Planctomycetota bacterium]
MSPLCVVFALLIAGCNADLPGKPNPKERPIPAEKVLAFDVLYSRNCAGCHGKDGKQGPAPPLNDPLFRAIVPADELEKVVSQGRPGTPMAAFAHRNGGSLTAVQVQVLVNEIKGVRYRIVDERAEGKANVDLVADDEGIMPKWGAVAPAAPSIPSYGLAKTNGNDAHGAEIFAQACASCHGNNGKGVVKDGKRLNKINDPAFLALISDQAIRRIIITGRLDLKMPDYSQSQGRVDDFQPLTSTDITDLVALLASWRRASPTAAE